MFGDLTREAETLPEHAGDLGGGDAGHLRYFEDGDGFGRQGGKEEPGFMPVDGAGGGPGGALAFADGP